MTNTHSRCNPRSMNKTYKTQETAEILRYNRANLARHVKNGTAEHLKPIIVGRNIRFSKAVIDMLVDPD